MNAAGQSLEKCSLLEWTDAFSFITCLTGDHILSHSVNGNESVVSSRNVGLIGVCNLTVFEIFYFKSLLNFD
jgi:hypothetical protein